VEALFEGDALDVEKLIAWCRRGPPSAQVSDVQVYEEPYRAEFTDFVVRYDSWE
jgi:acylphosphatase